MEAIFQNSKLDKIQDYKKDNSICSIRLDANESFITFSKEAKEQLNDKLMGIEFNRYPDSESEELKMLYAEYCGVNAANVIAGNGSDEMIQLVINVFVSKDDKILTLKPDFSMYKFFTSIIEGNVIELDLEENMTIYADKIIKKATEEQVKLIVFSNPNNPTGGVIEKDQILKIVANCEAIVVVDEAYYEFYGESMIDYIDKYPNLIVLRTCSKALGIASARLGFLVSNEELVSNIKKVKTPFNISTLTQAVGSVILSNKDVINENIKLIVSEREHLLAELKIIENMIDNKEKFRLFPTKANFIYVQSVITEKIYNQLLEVGVCIRKYNYGAFRITVGNQVENQFLVTSLKNILEV